jgi:ribosome assembly protein YihI (activator of Der GTPase)
MVQAMLEYAFNKDMMTEDEVTKLLQHLESGVEGNQESMDYVNNEFARIYEMIEEEMTLGATTQLVDEIYDYLKKQGG